MSDSSPQARQDTDEARNLRDRLADIFRSRPFNSATDESGVQGAQGLGITNEPDVRTRLLESYNRSDPACGERRCSHGTFSPHVETAERLAYMRSSGSHIANNGIGEAGMASSPFRGGDTRPESHQDSEYTSQMKSSISALSTQDSKKL